MHYLMNYFLFLYELLLEFLKLKFSFPLALVIHPCYFVFYPIPLATPFTP